MNTSKPKVFVDGHQGSTGLRITELLAGRGDLELLSIDPAKRKHPAARAECYRSADVAVLCLPDQAADEALELLADSNTRVIDTSSSRRVDPAWVYGLPELEPAQREVIRVGARVANPGCYPQTFILALRPLIEGGHLEPTHPFTVNAVSGYSGGGRKLVETYQSHKPQCNGDAALPFGLYALGGGHKHLPEMTHFAKVSTAPLFVPSVVQTYCGMLVSVPLPAAWIDGMDREAIYSIWADRYSGEPFINVISPSDSDAALRGGSFLDIGEANNTNRLDLMVFGSHTSGLVLIGRLDNLGKGAAGNAVQCLNLMLGLPETAGLDRQTRNLAA